MLPPCGHRTRHRGAHRGVEGGAPRVKGGPCSPARRAHCPNACRRLLETRAPRLPEPEPAHVPSAQLADPVPPSWLTRPPPSLAPGQISLGDSRAYYLSTAGNMYGVVSAVSSAGYPLYPLDWETMRCPHSGSVEPRKVARL